MGKPLFRLLKVLCRFIKWAAGILCVAIKLFRYSINTGMYMATLTLARIKLFLLNLVIQM